MQKRFRGLGFIGLILKIVGIIELFVGLACLIIMPLVFSDSNTALLQLGVNGLFPGSALFFGILSGLLLFLVSLVCGLLTFSVGEIFNLLIAIEENTRVSKGFREDQT